MTEINARVAAAKSDPALITERAPNRSIVRPMIGADTAPASSPIEKMAKTKLSPQPNSRAISGASTENE